MTARTLAAEAARMADPEQSLPPAPSAMTVSTAVHEKHLRSSAPMIARTLAAECARMAGPEQSLPPAALATTVSTAVRDGLRHPLRHHLRRPLRNPSASTIASGRGTTTAMMVAKDRSMHIVGSEQIAETVVAEPSKLRSWSDARQRRRCRLNLDAPTIAITLLTATATMVGLERSMRFAESVQTAMTVAPETARSRSSISASRIASGLKMAIATTVERALSLVRARWAPTASTAG